MLEGTLDAKYRELWRWRPDLIGKDLESAERFLRPKHELAGQIGWDHE
jgi:sarcosine oxidase / L-pipecolate oxidase